MAAAVAERPQASIQPWKPKSRQKPTTEETADGSSTPASPAHVAGVPRDESPSLALTPAKHPLENRWSMWYFKNDKQKDWKDNHKIIASCDTIEVCRLSTVHWIRSYIRDRLWLSHTYYRVYLVVWPLKKWFNSGSGNEKIFLNLHKRRFYIY